MSTLFLFSPAFTLSSTPKYKAGVPIEVAPFAYAKLLQNLHRLGSPSASLRMARSSKAGPVVSDNGNFVIDAPFEREMFEDVHELLTKIKMLTGVVEVGLFCGMARAAYFGNQVGFAVQFLYSDAECCYVALSLVGWKRHYSLGGWADRARRDGRAELSRQQSSSFSSIRLLLMEARR